MERNKIIIVALLLIIIALLAGILVSMPNFSKVDSQLEIIGNDTLNEGDNLQVKLVDVNGTALVNQTVNITIIDKDKISEYHSVITNDEGVGELKIDKSAGEYIVNVSYGGNDNFNGCNATKNITVEEEVVEAEVDYSSQSQTSSGNSYDINNLPPSNDPYQETSREQIDENTVMQKYEDGYISYVDLRTGERSSGGFYK